MQTVSGSLSIYLPAEDTYVAPQNGPRKAPGDPGTTEQFTLPNYIYIFIMKKGVGDTWTLWKPIIETATDGEWTKKRYVGPLQTTGDSIYQYNKEFNELLAVGETNFAGRVYAIASAVPLEFGKTLDKEHITSLSDLLNLKFDVSSVKTNVQNIYSTPYNYLLGDTLYYCSFKASQKVPHVNLMLYHVAAKVDITWNVADSARIKKDGVNPIRLTQMDVCNLYTDSSYCFRPMENSSGASPLAPAAGKGDTLNLVSSTDEGLWWEGRSYFYTIPYTCTGKAGYYPLQMKMATNDSTKYYQPTIYLNIENDTTFVPWMRATFNLKKPLTEGTDTKTVD